MEEIKRPPIHILLLEVAGLAVLAWLMASPQPGSLAQAASALLKRLAVDCRWAG